MCLLMFCGLTASGQWLGYDQIYRDYNERIEIGESEYIIIYRHEFARGRTRKMKFYDMQALEFGKTVSKYSSLTASRIDSLMHDYLTNKKRTRTASQGDGYNLYEVANLHDNEKAVYEDIYFNYPNVNEQTVLTKILSTEYVYTEPIPQFEWQILTDTASILDYQCIKAETTFRGRTYIAWFTPLIPIKSGPWKFNGLPGLILKIADTEGFLEWTATGIQKSNNKTIYKYNPKHIKHTDRKSVNKVLDKRWKDPVGLFFIDNPTLKSYTVALGDEKTEYTKNSNINFQVSYWAIPELE